NNGNARAAPAGSRGGLDTGDVRNSWPLGFGAGDYDGTLLPLIRKLSSAGRAGHADGSWSSDGIVRWADSPRTHASRWAVALRGDEPASVAERCGSVADGPAGTSEVGHSLQSAGRTEPAGHVRPEAERAGRSARRVSADQHVPSRSANLRTLAEHGPTHAQ